MSSGRKSRTATAMNIDLDTESIVSCDTAGSIKSSVLNSDDNLTPKTLELKLKRKQKDAERHRKLYNSETEEQRKKRRERDALRHKLVYQEKKRLAEAKKLQSLSEEAEVDSDISADSSTTTTTRPNSRLSKLSTLSIDSILSRSNSNTISPKVRTINTTTSSSMSGRNSTGRSRSKAVKSSRSGMAASSISPIHNQAAAALLQLSASTDTSNTVTNSSHVVTNNTIDTTSNITTSSYTTTRDTTTTSYTTSSNTMPQGSNDEHNNIPTFDALLGNSRRQGGMGVFFPDPCPDDLTALRLPSESSFNLTYDPSTSFDQLNLDDPNTPPLLKPDLESEPVETYPNRYAPEQDLVGSYPDRYAPDVSMYDSTSMNLPTVADNLYTHTTDMENIHTTTDVAATITTATTISTTSTSCCIDKDSCDDGISPLLPTLEAFLFGPDSTTTSPILSTTSRKSITADSGTASSVAASGVTTNIEAMTIS